MADKNLSLGTIFTGNVTASWTNAIKRMEAGLLRVKVAMDNLNASATTATTAMGGHTKAMGAAAASTKKTGTSVKAFNKQIGTVTGAYSKFMSALKVTAAYGLASVAIMSVVTAVKAGVQEIIDYDQALKNLEAITGASIAQINSMGKTMRDVAESTKFSTGEVAQGMVLLGQAGFSAAEAMDAIQPTANLATGTLTSMQTTADLLTTTIRAFSLSTVEAGRVSDVMANAVNKSKLTVDKLRISFNFVGAAAAQTGLSLEETAASMMVLANSGLRASTIGTGLRQVLSRLLAPTGKLRSAFESHGIALDKVNPRLEGYQKALKNLLPIVWDNAKGAVDMGKAYQLFGLRGAQAMAVLARSFVTGEFSTMLDKTYEYGTAANMAAIQAEGLGVMLKNLADRFKLVAIAVGEAGLTGIMRRFLDVLKAVAFILKEGLESQIGRITTQFILWSAAIRGVTAAFAFFTVGKGAGLLKYFGMLGRLFTGWVAIFVAVGVAIYEFATKTDRAVKKLGALAVETERTIANLQLYSGVLDSLNKKKKEGEETDSQYLANLERLKEAVPELKDQIELSTLAHEKNIEVIKKLLDVKLNEQIQVNSELIKANTKWMKEHAMRMGLWARMVSLAKHEWKMLGWEVENTIGGIVKALKWLADAMAVAWEFWKEKFPRAAAIFEAMFLDPLEALKEFANGLENLGRDTPKFKKAMQDNTDLMRDVGVSMLLLGKPLSEVADHLRSLKKDMPDKEFGELLTKIEQIYQRTKAGPPKIDIDSQAVLDALEVQSKAKISSEKAYYSLLASLETDSVKKAEWAYNEKLKAIQKWHKEAVKLAKKMPGGTPALDTRKMDEIAKADTRKLELEKKAIEKHNMDVKSIILKRTLMELKLLEQTEKQKLEIRKKNAAGNAKVLLKLAEEEKQLTTDMLGKMSAVYDDWLVGVKNIYKEDSDEYKAALLIKEKMLTAFLKGQTDQENWAAANRIRERKKEIKFQLDHTKRFGEEYVALLKEAYDLSILNLEEYLRRRTAAEEGWWANFKYGLKLSAQAFETFNEMIQALGSKIVDQISGNMTSALWDWADGTKTAKEAMKDFANSTIRWLGEIITKWAIMNALTGIMGLGMKGGGSTSLFGSDTMAGGSFHKGGIVGVTPAPVRIVNPNVFANAQRYHSGLRSDEFPAILQKGEEVIPKGGSSAPAVTVNVINKSGQNLDVTQEQQRFDAGDMIIDVIVDAANRNKKGFRDNMKGMLR